MPPTEPPACRATGSVASGRAGPFRVCEFLFADFPALGRWWELEAVWSGEGACQSLLVVGERLNVGTRLAAPSVRSHGVVGWGGGHVDHLPQHRGQPVPSPGTSPEPAAHRPDVN